MNRIPRPPSALVLAAAALVVTSAQAQIYRSVDAQGQVTFTDTPGGGAAQAVAPESSGTDAAAGAVALPYALRQLRTRYPVTLYAGPQCAPCDAGRKLLNERGVPFTEKTVAGADDADALRALTGTGELPVLSVGTKRLNGYEQANWTQYLDAAGYPASSQLPADWRAPAPTPLAPSPVVASDAADAVTGAAASAEPGPDAIAPARTPDNPAGIRF